MVGCVEGALLRIWVRSSRSPMKLARCSQRCDSSVLVAQRRNVRARLSRKGVTNEAYAHITPCRS